MDKLLHIVLVEPKIPANTGNLIRLTANMGGSLHLIHPLGFELENTKLRRAGLDYADLSQVYEYDSFQSYAEAYSERRLIFFTTKGAASYSDISYSQQDSLIFGSEDIGLDDDLLNSHTEGIRSYIPMMPGNRSINLSNAVAIVSYEAWKQLKFEGSPKAPRKRYFS